MMKFEFSSLCLRIDHARQGTSPKSPEESPYNSASKARDYLCQDLLEQRHASLKVHVVAHALGLPTVDGRVGPKACLKLLLG